MGTTLYSAYIIELIQLNLDNGKIFQLEWCTFNFDRDHNWPFTKITKDPTTDVGKTLDETSLLMSKTLWFWQARYIEWCIAAPDKLCVFQAL